MESVVRRRKIAPVTIEASSILQWSVDDVADFLVAHAMPTIASLLRFAGTDGKRLLTMTLKPTPEKFPGSGLEDTLFREFLTNLKSIVFAQEGQMGLQMLRQEAAREKALSNKKDEEAAFALLIEEIDGQLETLFTAEQITLREERAGVVLRQQAVLAANVGEEFSRMRDQEVEDQRTGIELQRYHEELMERERRDAEEVARLVSRNPKEFKGPRHANPAPLNFRLMDFVYIPKDKEEDEAEQNPANIRAEQDREYEESSRKDKVAPFRQEAFQEEGMCTVCAEGALRVMELGCSHKYCYQCLKTLFERSLQDTTLMPPRCCKVEIDPNIAPYFLPDEEDLAKFHKMYF